jgi:hypothetical protein
MGVWLGGHRGTSQDVGKVISWARVEPIAKILAQRIDKRSLALDIRSSRAIFGCVDEGVPRKSKPWNENRALCGLESAREVRIRDTTVRFGVTLGVLGA